MEEEIMRRTGVASAVIQTVLVCCGGEKAEPDGKAVPTLTNVTVGSDQKYETADPSG